MKISLSFSKSGTGRRIEASVNDSTPVQVGEIALLSLGSWCPRLWERAGRSSVIAVNLDPLPHLEDAYAAVNGYLAENGRWWT